MTWKCLKPNYIYSILKIFIMLRVVINISNVPWDLIVMHTFTMIHFCLKPVLNTYFTTPTVLHAMLSCTCSNGWLWHASPRFSERIASKRIHQRTELLCDPEEALVRLDSFRTSTSLSLTLQVRKHQWSASAMRPIWQDEPACEECAQCYSRLWSRNWL